MARCGDWPIGICSWSLGLGIADVMDAMKRLEINYVHLPISPALEEDGDEYLAVVREQDWTISSTMIGFVQEDYSTLESIKMTGGICPDECWDRNRDSVLRALEVTAGLGVKYVSIHAGFLDHTDEDHAKKFVDRTRCLADKAAEEDVMLLMETGQETAADLRHFLEELDHPALGVNFDPANMILYGMGDPVAAARTLAPWIKHVHIKDAVRSETPGTWGKEVPWGEGEAGGEAFLVALREIDFDGVLAIEREGGETRFDDIELAVKRLSGFSVVI